MPNYAWYYLDRSSDTCYWCYSNEMSVTDFAAAVSAKIGKRISGVNPKFRVNTIRGGNRAKFSWGCSREKPAAAFSTTYRRWG